MARITKAVREELMREDTPDVRVKKIYSMYIENRKHGLYGGRRRRLFELWNTDIVTWLNAEHVSFCREFDSLFRGNEAILKKDVVIDQLMDKRLAVAYAEVFHTKKRTWGELLNPEADQELVMQLLDRYVMKQLRDSVHYQAEAQKNPDYRYDLVVVLFLERPKILEQLDADMETNGWCADDADERLERFLYHVERVAFGQFFTDRDLELLWKPETEKRKKRALLGRYITIKRDEPHEFHRMQLIAYLSDGILDDMEEAVHSGVYEADMLSYEGKKEARKRLDDLFEEAFSREYILHRGRLKDFMDQGGEGQWSDEDKILRRFLQKMQIVEDVKKENFRVDDKGRIIKSEERVTLDELYNERSSYQIDKENYVYMVLAQKAKGFENKERFRQKMVEYGYDPEVETEWLERMLYLLCLNKRDAERDFRRQMQAPDGGRGDKEGKKKEILLDGVEAGTKDIYEKPFERKPGVKRVPQAAPLSAAWSRTEEYLFEYSAMIHARDLILRILHFSKPKAHTIMQSIFYFWILPYQEEKEIQEIVSAYGGRRPAYSELLFDRYGEEFLAIMRLDLEKGLDQIMADEILSRRGSAKILFEEYEVLDKKLELFEEKAHLCVEECPAEHAKKQRTYTLKDLGGRDINIRDDAMYNRLCKEMSKDKTAVSKNISAMKKKTINWDEEIELIKAHISAARRGGRQNGSK